MPPIDDIHIVPVKDLQEHACAVQCLCRPAVYDRGPMIPRLVVHHAYDAREAWEVLEGGEAEPETAH